MCYMVLLKDGFVMLNEWLFYISHYFHYGETILQEDFDAYFSTFAPCTSNVILDNETGKNKGFGFVAFHDDGAGLSALDAGQLEEKDE